MKIKREKLFQIYSKNLEFVIEEGKLPIHFEFPIYICPLCKGIFKEEALIANQSGSVLTIEHVPPKAIGFSCEVITCHNCNHTHGTKLDSQFKKEIQLKSFFSLTPNSSVFSKFLIDDRIITRGTFTIGKDGKVNVLFNGRMTHPKYENELIKKVTIPGYMGKVEATFSTYNSKLAKLSLIRAAYLMLFHRFGYAFIFTKGAEIIRKYIANYGEDKILHIVLNESLPDDLIGINIITDPKELASYLVVIKIKDGNFEFNYGIILPGAHDLNLDVYDFILSKAREKENIDFSVVSPAKIDYLTEKSYCLLPVNNWK